MKMMFEPFAKKLFGIRCERLKKVLFIDLIVFWGLRAAGYRIAVKPSVMYLMVSAFSAGVMWRALASEDSAANMKNMFMLPFEGRKLVFSYVSAMGAYTLLTKTAGLLAVVLAVCAWSGPAAKFRFVYAALCAVNAVLATACVYGHGKPRRVGALWCAAVLAAIFLLWDKAVFPAVMAGSCLAAVVILSGTSAYAFWRQEGTGRCPVKGSGRHSVVRYLLRYLMFHRNYMVNTAALWGVACVLPVFFRQIDTQAGGMFVLPVGFAILSVNTPLGILLSCDPALERAVRALPCQKRAFCVPYALFVFGSNLTADLIFLGSFQVQQGGVTAASVLTAVVFALLGAAGSALMEWFFPLRGWKIESDLWHHPRKYAVPAVMLLLAGAAAALCG